MIEVIHPGLLTTFQDLGRRGYQRFGVPIGGAMDTVSLEIANYLVGNEADEGGLELTLSGTKLLFHQTATIAITGANLRPLVNEQPIPMGKAVSIEQGSLLTFSKVSHGCRGYVALAGGYDIEPVLQSMSTYLRASIGGLDGRALRKGDQILCKVPQSDLPCSDFTIRTEDWWTRPRIRIVKGPEVHRFIEDQLVNFVQTPYSVSPQSDRMGYRLDGAQLTPEQSEEMLSEPVTKGTIQVPADGAPIVLMADCQMTGGYPRIAQVIQADLPAMAQKKPGDILHFEWVTWQEARKALDHQRKQLKELAFSIQERMARHAYE